jgi:acetyl esterase
VIGSLDTHDAIARNLCAGAQCTVASVDYRMGPEHRFPAAVDDAVAAAGWLAANAAELGADPERVAVGGDSAGGNLAACVALAARDTAGPRLCYQLLVYPLVDYRCDSASYETYATGYGVLEARTMAWFRDHYLGSAADAEDWRASPLLAENHAGLPPALVITAECDVLHDEGVAYARALAGAGNAVEHIEASGMIHGFFGLAPMISGAVVAQAQAVEALRRAFGL